MSVLAGGAAVEEDEMTSELSVVETGGGDTVGSPKTAIAKLGHQSEGPTNTYRLSS